MQELRCQSDLIPDGAIQIRLACPCIASFPVKRLPRFLSRETITSRFIGIRIRSCVNLSWWTGKFAPSPSQSRIRQVHERQNRQDSASDGGGPDAFEQGTDRRNYMAHVCKSHPAQSLQNKRWVGAIASKNAVSCDTTTIAPGYCFSACSSACADVISRWFVGSSSLSLIHI